MDNSQNQSTNQRSNSSFTKTTPSTGYTTASSLVTKTNNRPHGKSRYAKKKQGRPNRPAAVKRGPAKQYISLCCSLPANKPALVKPEGGRRDEKAADQKGLGHWRCSGCRKSCKVRPEAIKTAEPVPAGVTDVPAAV